MTVSSYALSHVMKKQFREPVVLSILIRRLLKYKTNHNHLEGWLLHYGVGTLFNAAYDRIWSTRRLKPTTGNGLLLGAISGLIGLAVWKITLNVHPNPPKIDFRKYYAQIVAVHLVFGAFSALGYRPTLKLWRQSRSLNPKQSEKEKDGLPPTLNQQPI